LRQEVATWGAPSVAVEQRRRCHTLAARPIASSQRENRRVPSGDSTMQTRVGDGSDTTAIRWWRTWANGTRRYQRRWCASYELMLTVQPMCLRDWRVEHVLAPVSTILVVVGVDGIARWKWIENVAW
jgi:hypothetical protein